MYGGNWYVRRLLRTIVLVIISMSIVAVTVGSCGEQESQPYGDPTEICMTTYLTMYEDVPCDYAER
jgi:hypothetical protein